ncbi:prephenate dehydrogenase (NADP(+)) [Maudiozyma exigua]|uniref:Prephenate dehydrogenase [NADP(+)] n=1 Tax=Maudiozyma exigua TaxID=34358 RepID=A0A9P6WBW3_MAUEX|nr:prephenate dehydrogenase (NADP(+)) [Kazachstania exigua]
MAIGTEEQIAQWKKEKTVGIIGLGDMGLLYAEKFSEAGWNVVACDREIMYDILKPKYADSKFKFVQDGHRVSRVSDFIIYSVEAANIEKIVTEYGPSSKVNAIVGGQTSCKRPEVTAFEKYLPDDTKIITVHSLHGPKVNTEGQPLVIIDHRSNDNGESLTLVDSILSCLKSKHVYLTCDEHDKITADTQAVTHAAFLSMGSAWAISGIYPWEAHDNKWLGGIENVKINISLRIYSNKWHVYAGLAITNPQAHKQILQYATSVTELFALCIDHKREELLDRLMKAKEFVFGKHTGLLLLDDSLLDEFSLSEKGRHEKSSVPNSHLSLLAIVDSWYQLGINPYDHMICSTPLFRIFLGVSEYLFLTPGLLEQTIEAGINDKAFRSIDLEFVIAARKWSSIVSFESFDLYQKQFEDVQRFFEPMFPAATKMGNDMIRTILAHSKKQEANDV